MKKRATKYAALMMVLFAASAILSSCGGGGTPTATSSTTTVALRGVVTDADVEGATVKLYSMKTGAVIGTTTTAADGSYSINMTPSSYASDDVFYAIAEGGKIGGNNVDYLKFKSIIGSTTQLQAAGADGTVNSSEMPDLAVSNVTTAKVAIVEKAQSVTIDAGQDLSSKITTIVDSETAQESENLALVISLAASIKAVVDDPTNAALVNALGGKDVAAYLKDNITVTNGVIEKAATFDAGLSTAGKDLEDDIYADSDLIGAAVGTAPAAAVTPASLVGNWYGYHVDTWGDDMFMKGPRLMDVTFAATGGTCTTGQVAITIREESNGGQAAAICGTLTSNVLKFSFTPYGASPSESIEVVGNVDGTLLNGSYSMKQLGEAKAGGIFKLGKDDGTAYTGTYKFAGNHTSSFVSPNFTNGPKMGVPVAMSGSFTITSGQLTGTVTDANSTSVDSMVGSLMGPRVTAKVAGTNDTVFIVFLINESAVTGLYGSFPGAVTEPGRDPNEAGTFKMDSISKQ